MQQHEKPQICKAQKELNEIDIKSISDVCKYSLCYRVTVFALCLTDRWTCMCASVPEHSFIFFFRMCTIGVAVGIIPVNQCARSKHNGQAWQHAHTVLYDLLHAYTHQRHTKACHKKSVHNLPLHMQNCHAGIVQASQGSDMNRTLLTYHIPQRDTFPATSSFMCKSRLGSAHQRTKDWYFSLNNSSAKKTKRKPICSS